MVRRFNVLQVYTNRWGVTFYEVEDRKLGAIYWTKDIPRG